MRFSIFEKYNNLFLEISGRQDGSMRINPHFSVNRLNFLKKIKIPTSRIVCAGLVNGCKIKIVQHVHAGKIINAVDGLITREKNLFLSITIADCFPVFLYHPQKGIIGLLHAGWRGIYGRIIERAIYYFSRYFNANPPEILVGVGPGICKDHFEVKEDLLKIFERYEQAIFKKGNRRFIDLREIIVFKLNGAGIRNNHIEISNECTYCNRGKYFSHRRKDNGVMMVVFGQR